MPAVEEVECMFSVGNLEFFQRFRHQSHIQRESKYEYYVKMSYFFAIEGFYSSWKIVKLGLQELILALQHTLIIPSEYMSTYSR